MAYRDDTLCGIFHNRALGYGEHHVFLMGKYDEHGKVMDQYRSITWGQARRQVIDLARGLASLGLKKTDRCVLFAESRPEWIIADQAIQACGAVGVPLYPTLSRDDLIYMILDSEAAALITSTRAKAEEIVQLRREHDGLKALPVITMESWDGAMPENVHGFSDIMIRGRGAVSSEEIEDRIRGVKPGDTAAIIYTSGTTGRSKGVVLTQDNFVTNILQCTRSELMQRQKERDLHLTALVHLPLCHVYARSSDYHVAGLYLGSRLAFAENFNTIPQNLMEIRPNIITSIPRFFEKTYDMVNAVMRKQKPLHQKLFAWAIKKGEIYVDGMATGKRISQHDLTQFGLANMLVFDRLKKAMGMDRLILALSGGGKLPKDVCVFFRSLNIQLNEGYGLTETSPVINFNDLEIIDDDHHGPLYRWFFNKVLDTTIDLMVELPAKGKSPYGNPLNAARLGLCYSTVLYKLRVKPGTVGKPVVWTEEKIADDGEILVRGPQVFQGYWKMQDATKEAFTEDGFFKTGDIGVFDEEGFLIITDRKKDLFVTSGGKNIAPHPIELELQAKLHIEQACLVGDGRKYISALIVPDFEELARYAKKNGITYASSSDLVANEEIKALIKAEVDEVNGKLARYEQVKYFEILDAPFSEETGELTPTLKVKRKVVSEKFRVRIERMYRN
ncbi:MAG TPA: long-chain fatty acid--CoA ligase [Desulfomonilia bacterium]|nr:long-chain fatty acid--CoA ligase [Desulfomonilia bacterium]